jgi:glycerol-3-phosphate acyltransferase PlsY
MDELVGGLAVVVLSYVIGSIPWGFLIGRLKGIDIRSQGSGNIGATNVRRVLGRKWGALCFVLDLAKGLVPVLLVGGVLGPSLALTAELGRALAAAAAVVGHIWPVWLGFKGGKGVSTTLGALVAVSWLAVLVGVATWVALFFLTRYVSVASLAAAVMLPVGYVVSERLLDHAALTPSFWLFVVLAMLIVYRHRSNIQRLRNGTEFRFGTRGQAQP